MQMAPFLPAQQEPSNWAVSPSQKQDTFKQASSALLEAQALGPTVVPTDSWAQQELSSFATRGEKSSFSEQQQ